MSSPKIEPAADTALSMDHDTVNPLEASETSIDAEVSSSTEQSSISTDSILEPRTATNLLEENKDLGVETISLVVRYGKVKYAVEPNITASIYDLKKMLEPLSGVSATNQKIFIKGLAKDSQTLSELSVNKSTKILLVGSTQDQLEDVRNTPSTTTAKRVQHRASPSASFTDLPHFKTIVAKGRPEDAMPGARGRKDGLPSTPITGMVNKRGQKVRLTFKIIEDQMVISTKERTDKYQMSGVRGVLFQAIPGHEDYCMMGFQLGPTTASRYWVYWVPAQYCDAIRSTIMM